MRNHSLYNIISQKLSPNIQRKLEKEIENNDIRKSISERDL